MARRVISEREPTTHHHHRTDVSAWLVPCEQQVADRDEDVSVRIGRGIAKSTYARSFHRPPTKSVKRDVAACTQNIVNAFALTLDVDGSRKVKRLHLF